MPGKRAEGVRLRSIALDDELWDAAAAKAKEHGESMTQVIRRKLREYLRE